ncbi:PREDICTED: uncharacterized protein LOC104807090, partial [Tarenaya hassleriana]|uniref:uncharacterized protein LOC104807090 n=1 Tax=Tarenaya hassleriana TaxID=28532 RepID=UPI00053C7D8A
QGVLVHDASYHAAVQLEGPEGPLLSILDMLMKPSPSSHSKEVSDSILAGRIYGSAMIHQVGGPFPQPIAPVTYMWRPYHLPDREYDGEGSNDVGTENRDGNDSRKCWVWIHASSFSEGYDSLKLACQKQMNETGVSLNCFSLEGRLAKLEILGPKASQLLEKTLYPVSCLAQYSAAKADLNIEEAISSGAILARSIMDPRTTLNNKLDDVTDSVETITRAEPDNLQEVFKCLWDASDELNPPEEESVLCSEKHQSRMDFLCLDSISETPRTSKSPRRLRTCPVLLLKHKTPTGWSLILPLSWVKVFWNAFVSNGAHAIGQREKRWIACDAGLPFFPSDFPDTNAYSSSKMSEAAELEQKAERRPTAMRPFRIPIPPPWNSILVTLNQSSIAIPQMELSNPNCTPDSEVSSSGNVNSEPESAGYGGNLFDGIVARTSSELTAFMKSSMGDNMLSFPRASNLDTVIKPCREVKNGLTHASAEINHGNKLCLVRVLLHAYKEGSFEDGAVVCALSLSDILLWKDSKHEADRPAIPQSMVKSYFEEQPSGTWELNVPEDSPSKESHRWPIGFVTTGFVRGSKKQRAEGYCEAVLLAKLREEQWRDKPLKRMKKDVYVLVRNLRSSAYRLALASVVLEQQDCDVDSL